MMVIGNIRTTFES